VHPAHARRGLGRWLIDYVSGWARADGELALTLTTFADVPWNGPYYARLGFSVVAAEALTDELRAELAHDAANGIPMQHRIAMCKPLRSA
jgi:predicted N-acetyltransferase YhbS